MQTSEDNVARACGFGCEILKINCEYAYSCVLWFNWEKEEISKFDKLLCDANLICFFLFTFYSRPANNEKYAFEDERTTIIELHIQRA